MRITVDARLLNGGGIGRYVREVTGRWLSNPELSEIHFLGDPEALERWLPDHDERGIARVIAWTDPGYSLRSQVGWQSVRNRVASDVTFFPHYDVPLVRHPVPSVVTVHDLTHFKVPDAFPAWKRRAGAHLMDGAIERAARVVAISRSTRDDLLERAPEAKERIRVIPNGVSPAFHSPTPEELRKGELLWGRYRPYLLMVGALKPHKNLKLALQLLDRVRGHHPDLRLLLAAPADPAGRERVAREARERRVRDRVEVVGPVDDGELQSLYAGAVALLFPSLYEGFGLPPLEAMAVGIPVLASNRASIPEVVGDAAPLLDPEDLEAWVPPLRALLETEGEAAKWIARGRKRVGAFSWERTSAETLAVLREAAGS